jgi:hypothetical protein
LWRAAAISFVLGIVLPIAAAWFVGIRLNEGRTSPSWRAGALELYESMQGIHITGMVAGLVFGIAGLVLVSRSAKWYRETGRSGCAPMVWAGLAFGVILLVEVWAYIAPVLTFIP